MNESVLEASKADGASLDRFLVNMIKLGILGFLLIGVDYYSQYRRLPVKSDERTDNIKNVQVFQQSDLSGSTLNFVVTRQSGNRLVLEKINFNQDQIQIIPDVPASEPMWMIKRNTTGGKYWLDSVEIHVHSHQDIQPALLASLTPNSN